MGGVINGPAEVGGSGFKFKSLTDPKVLGGAALTGGLSIPVGMAAKEIKTYQDNIKQQMIEGSDQQQNLLNEQKLRVLNEESAERAEKERTMARSRQRGLTASAQGRSSTILTSPLGNIGAGYGSSKTLLGV